MRALVRLQVLHAIELLATGGTVVGPLPCVRAQMLLQHGCLAELPATLAALVALLLAVHPLVSPQVAHNGEVLATVRTAEGLLPGVCALVRLQVGLVGEAPRALAAHERLLARVGQSVGCQVAHPAKLLAAVGALEGLDASVDAHMFGQGAPLSKALAAVSAGVWPLARVRAHVHAQVLRGAAGLAADGAEEVAIGGGCGPRFCFGLRAGAHVRHTSGAKALPAVGTGQPAIPAHSSQLVPLFAVLLQAGQVVEAAGTLWAGVSLLRGGARVLTAHVDGQLAAQREAEAAVGAAVPLQGLWAAFDFGGSASEEGLVLQLVGPLQVLLQVGGTSEGDDAVGTREKLGRGLWR